MTLGCKGVKVAENGRGDGEFAEKSGVYFYNFPLLT